MAQELAAFAAQARHSRGRRFPEPEDATRSPFQRDRDRIIHSTAFRRLMHKTQVFISLDGDHFRTRLTHSLEVAQIARSIARALGLDEDLTEAIALAHDLGHTPFGHAGEEALNACMRPFGGFEHNAQALRIVTTLERRYAAFDGLNLTWETLEGLVKHNGPLLNASGHPAGKYRDSGLPLIIRRYVREHDLELNTWPSAEAQVAAVADDIAYNAHDIDDGLRAGLIEPIDLGDLPLAGEALQQALALGSRLERARLIHETVRRMISAMIADVIERTRRNAMKLAPQSAQEVRALGQPFVRFSDQMAENVRVIQGFLMHRVYRHPRVMDAMRRAQKILSDLFNAYMNDPALLPDEWRARVQASGLDPDGLQSRAEREQARHICDFIAGMTDRYAQLQHRRLFDIDPAFR